MEIFLNGLSVLNGIARFGRADERRTLAVRAKRVEGRKNS